MSLLGTWSTTGLTGEAVLFSITVIIMVVCILDVLSFKRAAYAAIGMVGAMFGLAILYIIEQAPFSGIAQVVVYAGAIMMLFLFVIMMVGIGATDDYATQSKSLIVAATFAGLGLIVITISAITHTTLAGEVVGLEPKNPYSDEPITALAITLFSEYWFTMEVAGAPLIIAAIGTILLTHSDAPGPKISQRETAEAKIYAFAKTRRHIGQLPAPGAYAYSNVADVPAISGETLAPVEEFVPRVIRVRGLDRHIEQIDLEAAQSLMFVRRAGVIDSLFAPEASAAIPLSGSWGMSRPAASSGLSQPLAPSTEEDAALASTQEEERRVFPGTSFSRGCPS